MMVSPEMFALGLQICELEVALLCDPGNDAIAREILRLSKKHYVMGRMLKLGLKVVEGGRQVTKARSEYKGQAS